MITLQASLSSRNPTNFECRRWSASVHSRNSICATSSGRNHTHFFIFSAVNASPHRAFQVSGRFHEGTVRDDYRLQFPEYSPTQSATHEAGSFQVGKASKVLKVYASSHEELMPSDVVFSVGSHTVHVPSLYLLLAGMLLLATAGFLLGLSRGRRAMLQRFGRRMDELAAEFGRIANSLERIAKQPTYRLIAEASRDEESSAEPDPVAAPTHREETHSIPYSIFGR